MAAMRRLIRLTKGKAMYTTCLMPFYAGVMALKRRWLFDYYGVAGSVAESRLPHMILLSPLLQPNKLESILWLIFYNFIYLRLRSVQPEPGRYWSSEKCCLWRCTTLASFLSKLKRAWRESNVFQTKLDGHLANRTQRLGKEIYDHLLSGEMAKDKAIEAARKIAGIFGKPRKEDKDDPTSTFIEQLAFVSPAERAGAFTLADRVLAGESIDPKADEIMRKTDTAADIAMFGRMLADNPKYNREAAVQVAHTITTHSAVAEDDYYTAVDDLKARDEDEDAGAGLSGCRNSVLACSISISVSTVDLLLRNLDNTRSVRDASLAALVETAATVSPRGKQASFARSCTRILCARRKRSGSTTQSRLLPS